MNGLEQKGKASLLSRRIKRIAILPKETNFNAFSGLFSSSITAQGVTTVNFSWGKLEKYDAIIIHWPDYFFSVRTLQEWTATTIKLALVAVLKYILGNKIIWVVHNLKSHDRPLCKPVAGLFLRIIDGYICLNEYSRAEALSVYPELKRKKSLVTVHGHYLDVEKSPPQLKKVINGTPVIGCIGQVRPYKGLEKLISACEGAPSVNVKIVGLAVDTVYSHTIVTSAQKLTNISVDIRSSNLSDRDYEEALDSFDGVVLPYTQILNSGSVFMALSRYRPILAPNVGGLKEIQTAVGEDWLQLYDGDLTSMSLSAFAETLKRPRSRPNLRNFDWEQIGESIVKFVEKL